MNAHLRQALASQSDIRVIGKRYGGIQGPLFEVAVGDRCFLVGELTRDLILDGTPLEELDMLEIEPDAEEEQF